MHGRVTAARTGVGACLRCGGDHRAAGDLSRLEAAIDIVDVRKSHAFRRDRRQLPALGEGDHFSHSIWKAILST